MEVVILVGVVFLVTVEVLGLVGFTNRGRRDEVAKKIARELYDLQQGESHGKATHPPPQALPGDRDG